MSELPFPKYHEIMPPMLEAVADGRPRLGTGDAFGVQSGGLVLRYQLTGRNSGGAHIRPISRLREIVEGVKRRMHHLQT